MKILLINQPGGNRGDESAHKALLRSLLQRYPDCQIKVLANSLEVSESLKRYDIHDKRVSYIPCPSERRYYENFRDWGMYKGWIFIWNFHPTFWKLRTIYKWADVVVCAPGGICMGGFQDWNHLFRLKLAKWCKKPLAYYGRSFGPFPTKTDLNRRFKKNSLEMLKYFSFLSIRDRKTERLAEELNIPYISTVDSAFLDSPQIEIPSNLKDTIGDTPYMVFVPNYLLWHYAYKDRFSHQTIIDFYCQVIDEIWAANPNDNIVMLPQTFCGTDYAHRDIDLFKELANKKNDRRIIVVDDCYSSDIQQAIIHDAKYLIGGRYHSIVFALNQGVPCIALSYEHKMSGLLESLGKLEWCIDFGETLDSVEGQKRCLEKIRNLIPTMKADTFAKDKAKAIASHCMDKFVETFKKFK